MDVFISGPITGRPERNWKAFALAEAFLIRKGHAPRNPHSICKYMRADATHDEYMTVCIDALGECQAIYMLPGWEQSKGARMEYREAVERGMCIWYAAEEA